MGDRLGEVEKLGLDRRQGRLEGGGISANLGVGLGAGQSGQSALVPGDGREQVGVSTEDVNNGGGYERVRHQTEGLGCAMAVMAVVRWPEPAMDGMRVVFLVFVPRPEDMPPLSGPMRK